MSSPYHPVLSVSEHGSGDITVVLLHGYCEGNWIWQEILPFLPEGIRCICVELPGFGGSEPIPDLDESGEQGMSMVAAAIWLELGRKAIDKAWLVGHSLGGYVMLAMLELAPERVEGMVLFHSSPFADTSERKQVRDKVIRLVKEHGAMPFLETFADGLFLDKGEPWRYFRRHSAATRPETIATYAAIMRDRADRSELLRGSAKPLLIIAGRHDAIIPAAVSGSVAGLHPGFRLHFLENTAHTGMLEEPEESARLLAGFITMK